MICTDVKYFLGILGIYGDVMGDLTGCMYFGGKGRRRIKNWLSGLIPYERDSLYVEPFAGMLSILLNRPPVRREVVNDLDGHIYNFWRVVRSDYEKLEHRVKYSLHCRQTYYEAWEIIHGNKFNDNVERAWATYVLLQHGIVHSLNKSKRGWGLQLLSAGDPVLNGNAFAPKLKLLHDRLQNVQIEQRDAVEFLSRLVGYDHAVIYCDPPYATADTSQYRIDNVDVDALTDVLLLQSGRVAISGYGDEWNHLGWTRQELKTCFTYPGEHANRRGESRTEVLWMNYLPGKQQALF